MAVFNSPKGIFAALWLPTDAEGSLMRAELAQNVAFLKSRGINGILALGSTGEFPQFSLDARKGVIETVAELAAPLPVIANISDIRPRAVAELGRFARNLGLPAVAIMAPGFFPVSQDDALAHFLHASEAAGLPTFLYNYPEVTGTRIDLETVAAFADRASMAGIKQSGREFAYHKALVKLGQEKNFVVFTGADTRLPEAFALGVAGCIGGLVNFVPEPMVHLYRVCRERLPGSIHPAADHVKAVGTAVDRLFLPLNVAAGMDARGLSVGLPKAVVSARSREIYGEIVTELRAMFASMNLTGHDPHQSAA